MLLYVSASAAPGGSGTSAAPLRRISDAAQLAHAGDEVLVAPGIYREQIDPPRGGDGPQHPITYRALEPGTAIITGAEPLSRWSHCAGSVWTARVSNNLFPSRNPYTTLVSGDWYFGTLPVHTGELFLNGKAMYETFSLEQVCSPQPRMESWDRAFSVYQWYTCQEGQETVFYANFHEFDPNQETVELTVRPSCFFPSRNGISYITVSGFVLRQAATQWAPPTAFQEGLIGPNWAKGWVIEDCEISDSRCSGISLGKYLQPQNENKWSRSRRKDGTQNERDVICLAQYEGWSKETVGSHTIRRCNIHDCGQTGIVGHLGCVFSTIENCHIHHINNRRDLAGAEIGGIKLHAAIDTTIRACHIHNCSRGIWLDWQAQGSRITQCLFHNNVTPEGIELPIPLDLGEDIFVEVSHGPTLIDNCLLLSPFSARLCTQGVAFVHNLIAGALTGVGMGTDNGGEKFPSERYTPYHFPHRTEIAGFMTILHGDMRFYNNIFVQQPLRKDLAAYCRLRQEQGITGLMAAPNTVCGTAPYSGYPSPEAYFAQFDSPQQFGMFANDRYYDHLPVASGGNVYANGAQPLDGEQDSICLSQPVSLSLRRQGDGWVLLTDLYRQVNHPVAFLSSPALGQAFEPEQAFENPDGSPILFFTDYQGCRRSVTPLPGPFAQGFEAERTVIPIS